MTYQVCGARYRSASGKTYECTHPEAHVASGDTEHSWDWLRIAELGKIPDGGLLEIEELIEGITAGLYDPYIETLLAAFHGRKRALRSVPHPYGRTEE